MAKQTFTTGQVLTAAQMDSLQQTAMLGGNATAKTVSYVLVAADAGTVVTMNAAGATTITVNTGLFAAGDTVTIINLGAGVSTITAGTATVTTSGSLALSQNQGGVLRFTSASAAIFLQFGIAAAASTGGMTLLTTVTANNSATVEFNSISASYRSLYITVENFRPANDSEQLLFRFNKDTGANRHNYVTWGTGDNQTTFSASFGVISATGDNTTSQSLCIVEIPEYANTTTWKMARSMAITTDASINTSYRQRTMMNYYNQTTAISSLDFYQASGNITAGTFKLYGVN